MPEIGQDYGVLRCGFVSDTDKWEEHGVTHHPQG
jgi:hypothetical protein